MKHAMGVLAFVLVLGGSACTKSQILPITIAGVGGGTMVGGFVYSATLPEGSGFFGEDAGDSAAIGGLIFGGVALAVTGILFSVLSDDCDSDDDCWSGDRCEVRSHTCVAAQTLPPPASPTPEPEGGEGAVPSSAAVEPEAAAVDGPAEPSSAAESVPVETGSAEPEATPAP